jgi:Holliday junction resolvase
MMAATVARRLVKYLERSGFVVIKKPPVGGAGAGASGAD